MKKIFAVLTLAVITLTGCSGGNTSMDLNTADFSKKISEAGVVVLDVRTSAEFDTGHLHNAINIDVESPNFAQEISSLDKKSTYAVYCRTGRRSAIAVSAMKDAGFTSLFNLTGGITEWAAQGLPIEIA